MGVPFTAATTVRADITVYAQWKSYTYIVNFDSNGADHPADPPSRSVTSPALTVGTLPKPPDKTGFSFAGWNTAADGSGDAFAADTTVSAGMTVYAQWTLFVSASQDISLFLSDPGAGALTEQSFTLVRGGTPSSKTIVLAGTWDSTPDPEWKVDGRAVGSGNSVILLATDYTVGGHSLQVTASQGGRSWSKILGFEIIVAVSGLNLNKTSLSLPLGSSETLAVRAVPVNASNRVTWSSSNTAAVTVSPAGTLRAEGSGSAVITAASVENPLISAACTVTVTSPLDITLAPDDPGAGAVTEEGFTLVRGGTPPSNPIGLAGTWDSTPDPEWKVDGRAVGSGNNVTLQAAEYTVGGHRLQVTAYRGERPWSKTLDFTVIAAVAGLEISKTTLNLSVGAGETLLVRTLPSNAANKSVTWSSSKPSVVTVSQAGMLSALGLGSAVITAASDENPLITATCAVIVGETLEIRLNDADPGAGALTQESFIISKTGTGAALNITVTLAGTWDSGPEAEWRIDGIVHTIGGVCLINAVTYTVGGHTLQVTAYRGGIPWSKTIAFTVTN
jgi:uncharacterized repeat protein (TIGR02543 family)